MSVIPKPPLRNLFMKSFKRFTAESMVVATVITLGYKFLIMDPESKRQAEYYKNFDVDKDFEWKMKAGIFQSIDCNGVIRKMSDE